MALTERQWAALSIIPHFTAFSSLIGSVSIILDIVRDKTKLAKVYCRLMLGISVLDCFTSSAYFFSTWPIPVESAGPVRFAQGNTQTCTAQGFFVQMSIGGPVYNLCLSIYYLLVLNYRWTEVQAKRVEKFFHIPPWTFGVGTAVAGLPLTLFNNSNLWCWISGLPGSCSNTPDSTGDCVRGDNAWIYRWAFFYGPLWFVIFAVTIIMGSIVVSIMRQEKQSRRWRLSSWNVVTNGGRPDATARMSVIVFWQSIHYVCSFYITFIFPTTLRALQTVGKRVPYPIFVLMAFFIPMQGFFNSSVYFSPRIKRWLGQRNAAGGSMWLNRPTNPERSSIATNGDAEGDVEEMPNTAMVRMENLSTIEGERVGSRVTWQDEKADSEQQLEQRVGT